MSAAVGYVRLKLFARYAELVGQDELQLSVPLPSTVAEIVRHARAEIPGAGAIPERPLVAVNLRHVALDARVADGDEVAFLPPLAGG